jgi:glycerol-1-phosphate dehydrogenase [NAD(P)+]
VLLISFSFAKHKKIILSLKFFMNQKEIIINIANNLANQACELILKLGFSLENSIIISDKKIWQKHFKNFKEDFRNQLGETLILRDPTTDEKFVKKIIDHAKNYRLIIAFGSGTINDLCKYSASQLNIPYVVFTSACSMNGYCSPSASITINSHKKTLNAKVPIAVFSDLKILKQSPKKMTKAGIADALCLYSCWFDWFLSYLIFDSKFNLECFLMQENAIAKLKKNYLNWQLNDQNFLAILMEILLVSGKAMGLANGSYPASQSEHLIGHCLSMKYPKELKNILHGNLIAITSQQSLIIQQEILNKLQQNKLILPTTSIAYLQRINKFFGKKIAHECIDQYKDKKISNKKILQINEKLKDNQQIFFFELKKIYEQNSSVKKIFRHFKINTNWRKLSLNQQQYHDCVNNAKFIRNRFTSLDFLN